MPKLTPKVDLKDSFKYTSLDLENTSPLGGPNRTNAAQTKKPFNGGQYTVSRAGGQGFSGNSEGGGVITQTLHAYTPNNTYLDNNPVQNSANFTPKNNVADPNNANGFDATLK